MAAHSVTLSTATSASNGIKIERLSAEQARQTGFTHRYRIPFDVLNDADWSGAGDTITVTLGSTPTKFLVDKAAYVVTTAFVCTGGSVTLQVGTDGDPDNYIDNQALSAGVILADTSATVKTEAGSMGVASDVLTATFTTVTGSPSVITAGSVDVLLGVIDLDDIIG